MFTFLLRDQAKEINPQIQEIKAVVHFKASSVCFLIQCCLSLHLATVFIPLLSTALQDYGAGTMSIYASVSYTVGFCSLLLKLQYIRMVISFTKTVTAHIFQILCVPKV